MIKNMSGILLIVLVALQASAIPFSAQDIIISGPSQTAADVGLAIHRKGGNVVDVAIATGLALAVTSPYYASLGGGGLAILKTKKMPHAMAIDFRETAPQQAHSKMYTENKSPRASELGGLAVAVPGIVAGYFEIHKKYGHLKWNEIVAPAHRLALDGFRITGEWHEMTNSALKEFNEAGIKTYLQSTSHSLPRPGTLFKQRSLAHALKKIQQQGRDGFYKGVVAEDLVRSVQKNSGIMSRDDLKAYQPRWLEPIFVESKNKTIALMPPPSSGGALIALGLHFLECTHTEKTQLRSLAENQTLAQILRAMFVHRNLLADPQFYPGRVSKILETENKNSWCEKLQAKKTISIDWANGQIQKLRDEISKRSSDKTTSSPIQNESHETTHFSVLNSKGEGLAVTITLNGNYGSKVLTEKYGIALNNEMDDFNTRPGEPNQFGLVQGQENEVQPGKRPLSSMSPTLILENNRVMASLGSPGGPRITSAVFQVLYRWLFRGYDIDRAIQAPRLHQQFIPETLYLDPFSYSPEMISDLKKSGWSIEESRVAKVYGVVNTKINGADILQGAFDSRGEGGVAGQ